MWYRYKNYDTVLSVVLVSADTAGWVDAAFAAGSLQWSAGNDGLMPVFRWFFVLSKSVKYGSNDTDRVSDGHDVGLVNIQRTSPPADDGVSLIYTAT